MNISDISNNSFAKKQDNNTSIMSVSMMSLENIKNEIRKKRDENFKVIEKIYQKKHLSYDKEKERQIQQIIFEEYNKEKEKINKNRKIKYEQEKQKREEEYKN